MKKLAVPIFMILAIAACTPTVKMAPPDKPIEINLNVNIDHNIKVKVDKDLEDMLKKEDNLF